MPRTLTKFGKELNESLNIDEWVEKYYKDVNIDPNKIKEWKIFKICGDYLQSFYDHRDYFKDMIDEEAYKHDAYYLNILQVYQVQLMNRILAEKDPVIDRSENSDDSDFPAVDRNFEEIFDNFLSAEKKMKTYLEKLLKRYDNGQDKYWGIRKTTRQILTSIDEMKGSYKIIREDIDFLLEEDKEKDNISPA